MVAKPKLRYVSRKYIIWDMQQNQEIHKNADWQDKMVEIEMRVSDMDGYKDIAFFHHLMIEKR